jgi:hypothetical protein
MAALASGSIRSHVMATGDAVYRPRRRKPVAALMLESRLVARQASNTNSLVVLIPDSCNSDLSPRSLPSKTRHSEPFNFSCRWRCEMATIAAHYMVGALASAGVKRVYGVVGDSLNGFTDALRRDGSIEWIHMRHEESAAFAAGAEAHLTGQLAVCCGSCGPGNLHLINGLFDCHRSGVPVLAIAAHVPSTEIGIDYFQATHPEMLFKECSHYVELVHSAEQLPQILVVPFGPRLPVKASPWSSCREMWHSLR